MSVMYIYILKNCCFGCCCSNDEEIHHIDIRRSGGDFGFSFCGGAEYNSPMSVLRIAGGGSAHIDKRLRVSCLVNPIKLLVFATYVDR